MIIRTPLNPLIGQKASAPVGVTPVLPSCKKAAENPGRHGSSASIGRPSRCLRSTASVGGPANPGASLDGPPSNPEGSSASLGRPRQGEGNLEGPQDAPGSQTLVMGMMVTQAPQRNPMWRLVLARKDRDFDFRQGRTI